MVVNIVPTRDLAMCLLIENPVRHAMALALVVPDAAVAEAADALTPNPAFGLVPAILFDIIRAGSLVDVPEDKAHGVPAFVATMGIGPLREWRRVAATAFAHPAWIDHGAAALPASSASRSNQSIKTLRSPGPNF